MDLYRRQSAICPTEKFQSQEFVIVGVGAVGHEVAMQLASMGSTRVFIVDFDRVEDHNCLCQGYLTSDIGKIKVDAAALLMGSVTPRGMIVEERDCKIQEATGLPDDAVWFSCTDSMSSRKATHYKFKQMRGQLLLDSRVLGETIRVCTDDVSDEYYPTTLCEDSEMVQGSCHAQMVMFGARIAASLLVQQMTVWLRGGQVIKDMTLNLASLDLYLPQEVG